MFSTMMREPLRLHSFLTRAEQLWSRQEVLTWTEGGFHGGTYGVVCRRARQVADALSRHGIGVGDRVGTLAWNTQKHLELYLAVPVMGAVLHTINFRLSPRQLETILRDAEDRILFVEPEFLPLVEPLLDRVPSLEAIVVLGEAESPAAIPEGSPAVDYEAFRETGDPATFAFADVDENAPCGMCYTSGTTGDPKGVVYSHRSNVLHAMVAAMSDGCGLSQSTVILPVVPMFHVNAWGIPYCCALVGTKLVLPGRYLQPEPLLRMMEEGGVTLAAGVPTIWNALLAALDGGVPKPSRLGKLLVGGAAAAPAMIQGFSERHGIEVVHAWGMTETSPLGTIGHVKSYLAQEGEEHYRIRAKQGLPGPLVEIRITNDAGEELPWDGKTPGNLEARGPWVTERYHRETAETTAAVTGDGWFRTGDVATMDAEGYMAIVDRTKDLIRSGGEWISSVEIENHLVGHEGVREAAVIPVPDPKWGERPMACVVRVEGGDVGEEELQEYLLQFLPRWQRPDRYEFLDEIPKTSVGKYDKKVLKTRFAG